MEAFSHGLFLSSVMALLVGLFLIFNAFSVSVTQRRSQIGILRALGVTRRADSRPCSSARVCCWAWPAPSSVSWPGFSWGEG